MHSRELVRLQGTRDEVDPEVGSPPDHEASPAVCAERANEQQRMLQHRFAREACETPAEIEETWTLAWTELRTAQWWRSRVVQPFPWPCSWQQCLPGTPTKHIESTTCGRKESAWWGAERTIGK